MLIMGMQKDGSSTGKLYIYENKILDILQG